jgi:hypothetical protein
MSYIALGAAFWVAGVIFVRLLADTIYTEDSPWIIPLYLLSFPAGWLMIYSAAFVTGIKVADSLPGIVIMNFTALMMDGVTITWFHEVYSDDLRQALQVAGSLLWIFGSGLLVGWWVTRPSLSKQSSSQ